MSSNFFKIRNGVNVGVLSADPSGGTDGDMYYNSTLLKYRMFRNSAWHNAADEDTAQTLSNKTLDNTSVITVKDTNLTIQDDGDVSKQVKFDASGVTTATTRTLGIPDVSSNLLARTSTDQGANRVTNKDLEAGSTKIVDASDTTKKAGFSTSGASTGTTTTVNFAQTVSRNVTFPDADVTLAGRDNTEILSNKTLPFLKQNVANDSTTTGAAATLASSGSGVTRLLSGTLTSLSAIPIGQAGQQMTIENKTGNLIIINNEDPGVTASTRIQTGTGGSIPLANNASLLLTYDTGSIRWQIIGGTGSGSGSGTGKNYLSNVTTSQSTTPNTGNGNFELGSTSGWSLGTTGTLTNGLPTGSPTFGSGASGNLSLSVVSSGTLAGSYSGSLVSSAATTAGNMLASDAFNIDNEDQAKVLKWSFSYKAQTNPGNANWSGTSSNSFGVAFYDVTNSAWLSNTGQFSMTQSSGIGLASGSFQTNLTTASIRMVVYNVNATSGAITLYVDDFTCGPQAIPVGAIITDWKAFTPTGSWTTNSTYTGFWRRVGNEIELQYQVATSGAPNNVQLRFDLPSFATPDANQFLTDAVPRSFIGDSLPTGATRFYIEFDIVPFGGTPGLFAGYISSVTTNIKTAVTGTTPNAFGANGQVSLFASYPVAGWSSNVQMSNDTDTRVVAMQVNQATPTATVTSTPSLLKFTSTPTQDTHGAYSTSTGFYTVPVSGFYRVTGGITVNGTYTNTQQTILTLAKNNSVTGQFDGRQTAGAAEVNVTTNINGTTFCNAGDTLALFVSSNATGASIASGAASNYFHIERLSGPSVVAATESVNARYFSSSTAQSTGVSTTIVYATKDFDSHNAYSAGTYTIPVSGKYQINAGIIIAGTYTGTNAVSLSIFKNGTSVSTGSRETVSTMSSLSSAVHDIVSFNAGDLMTIRCNPSATSPSISASNTLNFFSIARVDN